MGSFPSQVRAWAGRKRRGCPRTQSGRGAPASRPVLLVAAHLSSSSRLVDPRASSVAVQTPVSSGVLEASRDFTRQPSVPPKYSCWSPRPCGHWVAGKQIGLVKICTCVFSQNLRKSHLHVDKEICLCCSNNHFLTGGKAGHMSAKWLVEGRVSFR